MATSTRVEWVSVVSGIAGGISLMALFFYVIFYFYSLFYGCGCGEDLRFSKPASFQSNDPVWGSFQKCKIKLARNLSYKITYLPAVTAMDGKNVTISGFMQPLEAKDRFTHFLLTRNSPSCAYCPPSNPNEIVEVFSSRPVKWEQNLVTISGTLNLVDDGSRGIFFQMKDSVERR